jgi:hypothetical protein
VASLTGRWREPSLSFKSSFKEVFKEVFCCLPSKTPLIPLLKRFFCCYLKAQSNDSQNSNE